MRYVFGTLALAAAIVIVGYSATTLFTAAYSASSDPWQQMLAGTGAAAIVLWEATALILIGAAWHRGYKPVAVMSTVLLVVAMAVTLTWEARIVIGGQADKVASRSVDAKKMADIERDLTWLRDRRDQLGSKTSSKQVRDELEWISNRIATLETDRGKLHAVSEVTPEAAWAARFTGKGTEQDWADGYAAIKLLFWMLARVCAAPLAVAAMMGVKATPEPRRREEASHATLTLKEVSSPVLRQAGELQTALVEQAVLKLREQPVTPGLERIALSPKDFDAFAKAVDNPAEPNDKLKDLLKKPPLWDETPDPTKPGGGKPQEMAKAPAEAPAKGNLPSEKVGERTAAFFESDADDNVVEYGTKRRLTPKEQRRLAREQALKKKAPKRADDEEVFGEVEVWANLLLRKGEPDQYVTSKAARTNFREYCEMHNYQMLDKKVLSKQIGDLMDKLNGVQRTKGVRRPRNAAGAVWHGYYLLDPSVLQKMKNEPMRRTA